MRVYLLLILLALFVTFSPISSHRVQADEPEIFVDVSQSVGINATHRASWNEFSQVTPFTDGYLGVGQAWGDYDNDGWVDLYVTGNLDQNHLYKNLGDGTFQLSNLSSSVSIPDIPSGGAVWSDYDNDGWRDLYVLNHGANVLFRNIEGNAFEDVTAYAGIGDTGKGKTASWGDYDNDGLLDLYVANWSCYPNCDPINHTLGADRLYHNNGDGTFTDVSDALVFEKRLGAGFVGSFADYDNDGDLDIYVINDKLKNPIGNVLWRNDGPPTSQQDCVHWCWREVSEETGTDLVMHGMGLAIGDYDNDLDLDFYTSNMVEASALLNNQGDGTMVEIADDAGVHVGPSNAVGWGTGFLDYDNDGWLDIYLSATGFRNYDRETPPDGMHFPFRNFLFKNKGDGTFADTSPTSWIDAPQRSVGFAYADYDQDGWVDFVVGNWNNGYQLYRNQGLVGQDHHWLTIRLTGGGPINRDAVGARVYLTLDNGQTIFQEVKSGSSMGAGNDTALHFGLGTATVSEGRIVWPNGEEQFFSKVAVDRLWHIQYPTKQAPISPVTPQNELFVDVTNIVGLDATHQGYWNMFNPNFSSGYLGIGQAWGDYDNDGWVDLYVTGNMVKNRLYRNQGDGTFAESTLSESIALPDVLSGGAVWADYDNDGWRDLYVLAHGANVLFHNDQGQGFSDVTDMAGVGDTGKGSTATWGDFDQDGYLDLYVANWACYPECDPLDITRAQDRLYHNNGDGTFTDISDWMVYEKLLGAGFTASFVDFDNDQDLDLYVVNDALKNPIGNVLWRNDGPGCGLWCWADISTEAGADTQIDGMGLAVGDYDNDLDLDFYFSNMVNPMALLRNDGDGTFAEVAKATGVHVGPSPAVGWGTSFFDYNNDGWLDLYLATTSFRNYDRETPPDGMHFPYQDFLFENNQDGTFVNVSPDSWLKNPLRTMGFAYADYDHDGLVDFVVGNWNNDYRLFRNQGITGKNNNWISIRLTGQGPINRDAIGSRVYVTTSNGHTRLQEVKSGSSLGAGNDTALHIGLGNATIESVRIVWPNGQEQIETNVDINQIWTISYPHEETPNNAAQPATDETFWGSLITNLRQFLSSGGSP